MVQRVVVLPARFGWIRGATQDRRTWGANPANERKQGLGRFGVGAALRLAYVTRLHFTHRAFFARKSDSSASVYINQRFPRGGRGLSRL